jgi:ABC-type metal ion transport system substrate-binding protein
MEEEKLYFTEITENEKRIINLIRSYVAPYGSVENYLDFLVDDIVHKFMDKTIKLQAFTDVMQHERENKELSNIQILARINQFEDYLHNDEQTVHKHLNNIFSDIIANLEGDLKPIGVYSQQEQLEEEEKILDKIQEV